MPDIIQLPFRLILPYNDDVDNGGAPLTNPRLPAQFSADHWADVDGQDGRLLDVGGAGAFQFVPIFEGNPQSIVVQIYRVHVGQGGIGAVELACRDRGLVSYTLPSSADKQFFSVSTSQGAVSSLTASAGLSTLDVFVGEVLLVSTFGCQYILAAVSDKGGDSAGLLAKPIAG